MFGRCQKHIHTTETGTNPFGAVVKEHQSKFMMHV